MESCGASVEVAGDVGGCVIGGEGVAAGFNAEFAMGDAVAKATTGGTQVGIRVMGPAVEAIVADGELLVIAVLSCPDNAGEVGS